MPRVEREIVVHAPVQMVYNQWTQFEEFPRFMEGVEEVRQVDDRHLHWRAEIAGRETEWDAEIREQAPDRRIAWTSTSGRNNAGAVEFEPQADGETKVHLEMDYDLEGMTENVADALGMIERRVQGDLERFKEFIESREEATGGWRGEIQDEPGSDPQAIRGRAFDRQEEPGPGGAPGGQTEVDPHTGRPETPS